MTLQAGNGLIIGKRFFQSSRRIQYECHNVVISNAERVYLKTHGKLFFGFMANAQTSQNVQFLGNYQGHRDLNINGTYYSGVWGYYDENGREYGILGALNGTAIVDLSFLPDSLHEVAFVPGPPSLLQLS